MNTSHPDSAGTLDRVPVVAFRSAPPIARHILREARALLAPAAPGSVGRASDDPDGFPDQDSSAFMKRESNLEAELLLADALGLSRAQLFAHLDRVLTSAERSAYAGQIGRRLRGEPVAYIRGRREFFGLDFYTDRRVLVPRPETELLVELAIEETAAIDAHVIRAIDVGTGSGAIAVALAKREPRLTVYATDSSADALVVAAVNCRRHGVAGQVRLLHGDLLSPVPEAVHIIVANLPYIPSERLAILPREVAQFEPAGALLAGEGGLALYRRLIDQARGYLLPRGVLLAEIDPEQATTFAAHARRQLPVTAVDVVRDYAGRERVALVRIGS
jgi:release factor glutamine methyltransferase